MDARYLRHVQSLGPQGHVAQHLGLAATESSQNARALVLRRGAVRGLRYNASLAKRLRQPIGSVHRLHKRKALPAVRILLVAFYHQLETVGRLKHVRQLLANIVSLADGHLRQADARLNRQPTRRHQPAATHHLLDTIVRHLAVIHLGQALSVRPHRRGRHAHVPQRRIHGLQSLQHLAIAGRYRVMAVVYKEPVGNVHMRRAYFEIVDLTSWTQSSKFSITRSFANLNTVHPNPRKNSSFLASCC